MAKKDTLVNKFEKAGLATVLVVWILRASIGPVFNYTLLVTTTLLAIYYLWFGFFIFNHMQPLDLLYQQKHRSINRFNISMGIIMGVILSYGLIAILFGFLFFPGMQMAMITAAAVLVLLTAFIIIYRTIYKKHRQICRRFYVRASIIGFFLAILLLPPTELRLSVLFRDHPDFQEAYMDYRENPDDEKAKERLREERSKFR